MATCSFIKATDAKSLSRNNAMVWGEICELQTAILAAIAGDPCATPPVLGAFETLVTDGTPFTSLNEISAATLVTGGTGFSIETATAAIDDNGTGGSAATLTPIVTGQVITGFTITNGGSGYTPVSATAALSTPSNLVDAQDETDYDGVGGEGSYNAGDSYFIGEVITLSESSTATVDAVTGTGYVTIAAQDETDFDGGANNGTFTGGTGYAALDTITLSDGTVITADTVAAGVITEFTVTTSSTSKSAISVQRVQLSTSGVGVGFSLTTDTNNETTVGQVTQFTIASPGAVPFFLGTTVQQTSTTGIGASFTLTPSTLNVAALAGGVGGALTPIVTNGVVTSVVINTAGTGYISGTPVTVTHPSGTSFAGNVSSVGGSGEILAVTITNGGTGYGTVSPLVTITHSTGFGFVGTVQQTAGVITGIGITDGGSLYGDLYPTIVVSDSTGTGAEINVTGVTAGVITSIQLADGGSNYSTTPSLLYYYANGTQATANLPVITLTVDTNTFGTTPFIYYSVLSGQSSDRVIQDQLQYVIDYFTALGYNIRAQVNPATNNTIQWQIIW